MREDLPTWEVLFETQDKEIYNLHTQKAAMKTG